MSGSVVEEEELLVVLAGLISCSNAFSAVELKLAESSLVLPVPKSALTCWLAIAEATILLICPLVAPFNVLVLKLEGNNPAL